MCAPRRGHRLGRVRAPRPRLGRPRHRRGQDDRHLLQAELPGAAAEARAMSSSSPTGEEARAAGYRACLRCKPDEVGRDREAVAKAVTPDRAGRGGAQPGRARRRGRLCAAPFPAAVHARPRRVAGGICARRCAPGAPKPRSKDNGSVTDAIYDAGYSGPSRFYTDAKERLGMTPSAWRDGGRGETIR